MAPDPAFEPEPDSNTLLRRIAYATHGVVNEGQESEYNAGYTGDSPLRAVGATVGSSMARMAEGIIAAHRPMMFAASLVGVAALGAGVAAQALGHRVGSPGAMALGYSTLVAVTGIVAAVAVNAIDQPTEV